jgi:fucose permease
MERIASSRSVEAVRWDRLTVGIGLAYALLAWSVGYGAVLPELRDDLHLTASVAAFHGSLFGICLLLFATAGRRLLTHLPNRTIIAASVIAMLGGGALFGTGTVPAVTLLGAAIAGAGSACLVIVVPAVVFAHQPTASTETMAVLNTFPMASAVLLPLVVGLAIARDVTWRAAYLAPLALIAVAIVLTTGRAVVPAALPAEPISLASLFRVPKMSRRWAVLACGVLVEIGTGIWAASIMGKLGGASKGLAAVLTIGFFVGMAAGRIALTRVLRRHTTERVLAFSFLGVLVALVPFLIGPGLVGRVAGLALLGLALSAIYPLSIARMFELHDDTAALGRAAAIASGVGVTFGPLLLGTLSDIVGLSWATVVLPVFAVAGLLMIERASPA